MGDDNIFWILFLITRYEFAPRRDMWYSRSQCKYIKTTGIGTDRKYYTLCLPFSLPYHVESHAAILKPASSTKKRPPVRAHKNVHVRLSLRIYPTEAQSPRKLAVMPTLRPSSRLPGPVTGSVWLRRSKIAFTSHSSCYFLCRSSRSCSRSSTDKALVLNWGRGKYNRHYLVSILPAFRN